ncbi:Metalloendopeptidase [Aphelenchoides fujianensis]|nr:Metalloendopeptidase [Aphelenchoides fujianensis]
MCCPFGPPRSSFFVCCPPANAASNQATPNKYINKNVAEGVHAHGRGLPATPPTTRRGKQPVSIGNGCIQKGVILHELNHAVGFFHEQSRADRDEFIKVVWSNVESGLEDQFDKYSLATIDHLGTKYDYGSVMHYVICHVVVPARKPARTQRLPQQGIPITVTNLPDNSVQTGNIPNCNDLRDDCVFLAGRGHCISAFGRMFMSVNCAQTCGRCQPPQPAVNVVAPRCEDDRSWCSDWAGNGMCTVFLFRNYMKDRCPRSCGHC